jgi:hypothetical protein
MATFIDSNYVNFSFFDEAYALLPRRLPLNSLPNPERNLRSTAIKSAASAGFQSATSAVKELLAELAAFRNHS